MEDLPLLSLVGKGFEISVPESAARAHSPVLAAALKNATTTTISVTEFDFPTVQCLAQCLNTGNYGVNANNFPSVSSAVGQQPIPENYTRDLLISHVKVNVVSAYFEIPKLSQLARSHIAPTLEHYWFDSAFLSTVTAALSSKDPYLHRLLVSKARDHLDSLINSSEFDGQTMLRSFHSTFRVSSSTPPSAETDSSVELEKLKKQVSTASSEREKLQQQLTAALSENEQLRQRVADVSSDRERLQQRVRDTDTRVAQSDLDLKEKLESQKNVFREQLAAASSENARLGQSVIDLSTTCQLLKKHVKDEENKVSQSTRNFGEASAAQDIMQKELAASTAMNDHLQEEISDVSSLMHRLEQERRVAEGQATECAHSLEEKSKAMEAVERELRVASSERALLRKRWDQEREKVSTLTKSNEDLNLALELEKNSDASVLARKRDELKKALQNEQKEVTRLTAEINLKAETLAAANKKADTYAAQKLRLENQYMEEQKKSNSFKAERDTAKQNMGLAQGRENTANNKITTLINTMLDNDFCRHCYNDFGSWVEDDGSCLVLRCSNCRCRHYR
ncbi:hypothetical protein ACHAPQ_008689 [Fusarium lateritium]